jgi:hypothetical protein
MRSRAGQIAALAACASGLAAHADVTYLLQERSITATTSADGVIQTVAAPDFAPFVTQIDLATMFNTPGGGTAPNMAHVGIDCQLDPNAIRVIGTLSGAGGISLIGGSQVLQFGEAAARIDTNFEVAAATPFRMTASPRPSAHPGDRFKIKLKDETRHIVLFFLDETMPPQAVDLSGTFNPGELSIEFQTELTVDGPETLRDFSFNITIGECYANCDASTVAPALNVLDFSCFLNRFVAGESYANCDQSTTVPVLNVNDFACFLQRFATGCS